MGFEKFASSRAADFKVVEELARSAAGSVSRAVFKYDDKMYVLKEIVVRDARSRRNAVNEVTLLQQLNHPHVIKFFGHFWDDNKGSGQSLFLVLEYCECGDLGRLISTRRDLKSYLEEAYIWRIFYQICLGVQHLHQNGIVHRDMKALNVLLVNNGRAAKVADLGVSKQVTEQESMLKTFTGTPLYLSPELVDGAHYTEKTDMWSLGILLYELCTLSPPFKANSISGLGQAIKAGQYPPLPPQYSPSLSRVIASLLHQDYRKRPNINQLVERVEHHMRPENTKEKLEKVVQPSPRPPQLQQNEEKEEALASRENSSQNLSKSQSQPVKLKPSASSLVEPIEKEAYHARRNIINQGSMSPRQHVHNQHASQLQFNQPSNGSLESDESSKVATPHDGLIKVDINRLTVCERREKNVLRKLLQAKGLMTSEVMSEGVSGNNSGRSSSYSRADVNQDDSKLDCGQVSATLELERKIQKSQDTIAILEEAIIAGGLISMENATRCNLPVEKNRSKQAAQCGQGAQRDSPNRNRAWPLSCQEHVRQETPPEIQIKCADEDDPSLREVFKENKNSKHSKHFSVFHDQDSRRPSSQHAYNRNPSPSAHDRPYSANPSISHREHQRRLRQEQQQSYLQQQHMHLQQQHQPSSGSGSRHVLNSKQHQRRTPPLPHPTDEQDIISHRDEIYGKPDVSREKLGRGGGVDSKPVTKQFHRVSHLTPSRFKKGRQGQGNFNIISGEVESS